MTDQTTPTQAQATDAEARGHLKSIARRMMRQPWGIGSRLDDAVEFAEAVLLDLASQAPTQPSGDAGAGAVDLDEDRCGPVTLESELRFRHEFDLHDRPGYRDSLLCRRTEAALAASPLPQVREPSAAEVPEGCTPADARVLRAANHALAQESHELQEVLADLYGQVKRFCVEQGEADFETGRAHHLLSRLRQLEFSWPFAEPPTQVREQAALPGVSEALAAFVALKRYNPNKGAHPHFVPKVLTVNVPVELFAKAEAALTQGTSQAAAPLKVEATPLLGWVSINGQLHEIEGYWGQTEDVVQDHLAKEMLKNVKNGARVEAQKSALQEHADLGQERGEYGDAGMFSDKNLIAWLEAKYSQHGEYEDKAAADRLRALTQEET